jgi:hypothetical protein
VSDVMLGSIMEFILWWSSRQQTCFGRSGRLDKLDAPQEGWLCRNPSLALQTGDSPLIFSLRKNNMSRDSRSDGGLATDVNGRREQAVWQRLNVLLKC